MSRRRPKWHPSEKDFESVTWKQVFERTVGIPNDIQNG